MRYIALGYVQMNFNAVPPLSPIEENRRDQRNNPKEPYKEIDLRVKNLVAEQAKLPRTREGTLLATAVDPTRKMLSGKGGAKETRQKVEWKQERKMKSFKASRMAPVYFPIGLQQCDEYPWVNSLMQFLLFIPTLRELISYVPKSLEPFSEFADLYFQDLEDGREVSRAKATEVATSLAGKFPQLFKIKDLAVNLDEAIQCIWKSAASSKWQRPDWQILWDSEQTLETLLAGQKKDFLEWFVSLRGIYKFEARKNLQLLFEGNCLQRQYFFKDTHFYMELDAFLEIRPEEAGHEVYYAYLKTGEGWVQCADERITVLRRPRSLEIALRRGVLFHYKRCTVTL